MSRGRKSLSRTITSVLGNQQHETLDIQGRKLLVIYGKAANTLFAIVPGWFVGNERYEGKQLAAVDVELIEPLDQLSIEQSLKDSLRQKGKDNVRVSFWGGRGIESSDNVSDKTNAKKARILVVDDDPAIREIIRMYLEREGHSVRTAANTDEALGALRNESMPNLMLLDIMMPGDTGWQFLEQLEHDPKLSELPVIAISGLEKPSGQEYDSKMLYDYLVKPFSMAELSRVVNKFSEA
jgi:CheY-like chemotaxis protein